VNFGFDAVGYHILAREYFYFCECLYQNREEICLLQNFLHWVQHFRTSRSNYYFGDAIRYCTCHCCTNRSNNPDYSLTNKGCNPTDFPKG
jgi:hypothetical protein